MKSKHIKPLNATILSLFGGMLLADNVCVQVQGGNARA